MLRKSIIALGTAALFAASTAQARECVTGWITHVDRDNDTIMLDSGEIFRVSGDINFEALQDGVRVKLVVKTTHHGRKALSVAPAAPAAPLPVARRAGRV